ncbi:putative metal-dependent phosphohydrolase protein [Rhizobium phage RHph_X66]|nr:putative metal-dependent phosphohydrolase protein [Rhizobium phage RHph_X66]
MTLIVHKHELIQQPSPAPADRGPYVHSANGRKIYPFDPRPEEISISVVAHHLANNNRWNGATQHKRFKTRISFSVAEHSVLVAKYVVEELKLPEYELEALLHDAPEYLFGDMIRPFKHHPSIHPIIKPIEDRAEEVIAKRFGLRFPLPKEIKIADEAVCAAEQQQIVPEDAREKWRAIDASRVAPYEIEMMDAYSAKEYFLMAYEDAIRRRPDFQALPSSVEIYSK